MSVLERGLLGLGLLLALGVPARFVVQAERQVAEGTPMLLELAPVDPRALMQGDYMRLAYALERRRWPAELPATGRLAVTLDERGVVTDARLADELEVGERWLRYHRRGGRLRLGPDAFFFQEGHAAHYEPAEYGELRVTASGAAILVGLRGADREVLGPPGDHPLQ